ncbi:SH3 domain-containing protein [Dyella sp. LX-66]|uniref:SH3 domain-containing protein n=1 Tax=unclassified Dyella TaxID=2634549 RepID=UPI001BDFB290|nr:MULTISPECIES: SH3 domain-containing protein [unclassified Dyella]MBT2116109.1 SH3 domain-containing protein [Dyella sp. LX-1]MBT2138119.1 SH3 domain-containing protein [Dyella sp. LX-66]
MRLTTQLTGALLLAMACAPVFAGDVLPIPPSGVIGTDDAMLSPEYWVARAAAPEQVILDRGAIDALNARLIANDPSMYDLSRLGNEVSGAQVHAWIAKVSKAPSKPLYDERDQPVPQAAIDAAVNGLALDRIPARAPVSYGLVVHRVSMRNLPTSLRAFPGKGLQDFEQFQESTLFPGDPVAIVHSSADGAWCFVVSPRYAAWVERSAIAVGTRDEVLSYAAKTRYRVITGDKLRTVYTPEAPAVSETQLDMGTRIPLAQLPPDQPVNGQGPYEAWTLSLPTRAEDGSLHLQPALLQRKADSAADYLPLTRANLIRQAFKFLGERYGWGHLYNGRDCSGFVSDVYRSMGVQLPRNTGDQARSPVLKHRLFDAKDSHEARMRALAQAQVGDLIYIPGHVMMFLGRIGGEPYVIQDVGGLVFRDGAGKVRWTKTNEVSVTPLLPLLVDEKLSYVDAMTSLVSIRP